MTLVIDVLLLLLAIAICHPNWLNFRTASTGADFLCLLLPLHHLNREAWLAGQLPLWNPFDFCGCPLAASMLSGSFHPLTFITMLTPNLLLGLKLFRLLHVWFLGGTVYCWLRKRYGHTRLAALATAIMVTCSAFVSGHHDHISPLAAFAYLPAVFWAFQSLLDCVSLPGRTPVAMLVKRSLILTLFLTLQLLAGHPQFVFYTLLLCLAHLVYWFTRLPSGQRLRPLTSSIPTLTIAGALSLGLCAIQLVPMQELSTRSYRIFDDYEYAAGYSMKPHHLRQMIQPYYAGDPFKGYQPEADGIVANWSEFGCYIGVISLLLIACSMLTKRFWRRRLNSSILFSIVVVVLLALGDNTPLHKWLCYTFYPIVRHMRVPPRILGLNLLLFGYLLSQALTWLTVWLHTSSAKNSATEQVSRTWLARIIPAICLLLILGELFWFQQRQPHQLTIDLDRIAQPAANQPGGAQAVRIDDVVAQLGSLWENGPLAQAKPQPNHRLWRLMPSDVGWYAYNQPDFPVTVGGAPKPSPFTYLNRTQRLMPNLHTFSGTLNLLGYEEGLLPTIRLKDFTFNFNRNLRWFDPDQTLLRLMGVETIMFEGGVDPSLRDRFSKVLPMPLPGPQGLAGPQITFAGIKNPQPIFQWLETIDPSINLPQLEGTYFLSEGNVLRSFNKEPVDYQTAPTNAPWGLQLPPLFDFRNQPLSIRRMSLNRWRVTWSTPLTRPHELWLAQAAYPGWRADALYPVDASPDWRAEDTAMQEINAIGSLSYCPEGVRGVEVYYAPNSYRTGAFFTLLSLSLIGAAIPCIRRRQRP